MSAARLIRIALSEKNVSQRELADILGVSHQAIRNKLYRDNMLFNDVEKTLDLLGYKICIIDKKTKKPLL